MSRYLSLILSILLVLLIPHTASAEADSRGATFEAETVYKTVKKLEETPNTFEAFVRFPKNMNTSDRGGIILGNCCGGNPCINFEIHYNGNPRLYWVEADGKVHDWTFKSVNVYTGEWEHIAIVRDSVSRKAHCYVNGVLKQTITTKANPDITPGAPLVLGGDYRENNSQYFKGEISSIAVYSNVRNISEIKKDMLSPGKDSLISLYDFNSTDYDSVIPDLSQNGYDVKNTATWVKEKEEVKDYAFSFMVIGDTQIVAEKYPAHFSKIYDYVIDNIEKKKVEFVFGLGDITNQSTPAEWDVTTENIFRMDGKVNYSVVRGNHDKVTHFLTAFPLSKYQSSLGGTYKTSMLNTWQELIVGDIKYLIFTLDFGAADDVLSWASEVIEEHPEHNVIITTHAYLFRDGTTLDANDVCPPTDLGPTYNNGDHMWNKLIRKHKNIVLVLSGHDPCNQIIMSQAKGDHGNTVTQMLIDGQGVDSSLGGVGLVATLYFSEDGRNVTIDYYSTIKEKYFMYENQFSFTLDLLPTSHRETTTVVQTSGNEIFSDTEAENSTPCDTTEAENSTPCDTTEGEKNEPSYLLLAVFGTVALIAAASVVLFLIVKKTNKRRMF